MLPLDHLRLHVKGLEPQAEVRGNVKEGLTYDDKRRDVKEGIRGQIMEIQPIIEHEPPNKGVQSKD